MSFTFGGGTNDSASGVGGDNKSSGGGFSFGGTTGGSTAPTFSLGGSSSSNGAATSTFCFGNSSSGVTPAFGKPEPGKDTTALGSGGGNTGGGGGGGFTFGGSAASAPSFSTATTATPVSNVGFTFNSGTASASTVEAKNDSATSVFGAGAPVKESEKFAAAPSSNTFAGFGGTSDATAQNSVGLTFTGAPSTNIGTNKVDSSQASSNETASASAGFFNPNNSSTSGTATPASTEESKKNSSATPGAFSFSSTPATTTTDPAGTSAAPATGGFSFGNKSSPGPTATTMPGTPTPPTPGPPVPIDTPGTKTSTNEASHTVTSNNPVKLQYQHLTVEQILNKFQKELEEDAVTYLEESRRVAEYDAILRDTQTDIVSITEQMQRCLLQQKEVEQTLTGIHNFQEELDRNLANVEKNVDQVFAAQSHLLPVDADVERENAYQTAFKIEARLSSLQDILQGTLQKMDAAQERALSGDVAKIVKILNQHQNSLASLEDVANRMEHDMAQVHRVLGQR